MNGPKFRLVGLGLLSGAALAVGCSGDNGGGGGGSSGGSGGGIGTGTATTSPMTTTTGNAANSVNTASSQSANSTGSGTASGTSTGTGTAGFTTGSTGTTGSTSGTTGSTTSSTGSTGSTSATTSGSTTGSASSTTGSTASTSGTTGSTTSSTSSTGSTSASTASSTTASTASSTTTSTSSSTTTSTSSSTTGSGGTGGTGCDDPAPPVGSGEGGAAGSDGSDWSGFNFVDESELDEWSIVACADDATDCVDDDSATVTYSCGVLQVEIEWPESANTGATKFQIENVVPETMLRDLSGKTLYARVRMTSDWVDGDGYDFDLIAQDYIVDADDGNDWKWFSTCYNGSGNCPENPSGETWAPPDWVPLVLPMQADLAPDGFAFDGVRKFAIQIATKHWADGEPFTYDSAPTSFEIDYVAW